MRLTHSLVRPLFGTTAPQLAQGPALLPFCFAHQPSAAKLSSNATPCLLTGQHPPAAILQRLSCQVTSSFGQPLLQTLKMGATPTTTRITPALDFTAALKAALEAELQSLTDTLEAGTLALSLVVCGNTSAQQELSRQTALQTLLATFDGYINDTLAPEFSEMLSIEPDMPYPALEKERIKALRQTQQTMLQHQQAGACSLPESPAQRHVL